MFLFFLTFHSLYKCLFADASIKCACNNYTFYSRRWRTLERETRFKRQRDRIIKRTDGEQLIDWKSEREIWRLFEKNKLIFFFFDWLKSKLYESLLASTWLLTSYVRVWARLTGMYPGDSKCVSWRLFSVSSSWPRTTSNSWSPPPPQPTTSLSMAETAHASHKHTCLQG